MISNEAISKLRRLMEARQARDEAKRALKTAEDEYREMEAEIFAELEDGPIKRINNIDLGPPWGVVSFQARETVYGRVIDEEAAIEHFKAMGMLDEVTNRKPVMARVNEFVRDAVEQGEKPPEGLDYYRKQFVTITRQKN